MIVRHSWLAAGIAAATLIAASPARAQSIERLTTSLTDTLQSAIDLLPEGVTNVRLGIGPGVYSQYDGSSRYDVHPVPVVSLRYKNLIEVDNNEIKLTALSRVFQRSANVGGGNSLRFGPLVSINFGRDESDSIDLRGMGDVGTSFELGGFVSYTIGNKTRFRVRARQDLAGGHNGFTVQLDASQTFIRDGRFALSGFVSSMWASVNYMKTFFGVNTAQAARSGLPFYHPGSSFKDVTVGTNGSYAFNAQWSVVANASYERLVGDAANSPLVAIKGDPNQFSISTFVVYTF